MAITHLKPESYPTWKEYYWTYQNKLAELHYLPLFEAWGVPMTGKKVLDVGCGDGGFTAALAEAGAISTGVEMIMILSFSGMSSSTYPWSVSTSL